VFKITRDEVFHWLSSHPNSFAKLLIFDHEFAKLFFGTEMLATGKYKCVDSDYKMLGYCYIGEFAQAWIYHLQKMALEPRPMTYIERFV